ncbi:CLIP-associating protein 1-A isoform X3 [Ischnura elegans]|uniref:CLIP-associating protein 1-A isoform X3 n=1 Tax=Ischnura elegans TaxID=197161 RepID=UPI001ED88F8E|nr:CLIP-associating protein 1-A isoform X3 [Ischnura elegans]
MASAPHPSLRQLAVSIGIPPGTQITLDTLMPLLSTTDTKKKLAIGSAVTTVLGNPDQPIECADIGQFIDGLIPWVQSCNFKVVQNGLEAIGFLVEKMRHDFKPYIPTVLPLIADRLGDSKDQVRDKSQHLILRVMDCVLTPQQTFDRLMPCFTHKNGKVREEAMICLQNTLDEYGAHSIAVSRVVPHIVRLLGDPTSSVRDAAFNTLVITYRHVGDRLRLDLQRKQHAAVPPAKMQALMAKFDELKESGDLLESATTEAHLTGDSQGNEDEVDRIVPKKASSVTAPKRGRATAVGASRSGTSTPVLPASGSESIPPNVSGGAPGSRLRRSASVRRPPSASSASGGAGAGSVDEEMFIRAFEDVPTVRLFSARELEEQMNAIKSTVSDASKDWDKRVDALKKVRSVVIAGGSNFDEFHNHLRQLEPAFQLSVKDLRSQVVREACISIAYLSQQLGQKFDHFAEALLPCLINLIMNCAKIVASSGIVTIRFVIRSTHSPRLVPIVASGLSSKSKDIRRATCDFLHQLLHTWSTHVLERHLALLQDAIRKGIADADPEARASARKAFWAFADHFRDQADSLLNSLDGSYKRLLYGELSATVSNSSSSNSLVTMAAPARISKSPMPPSSAAARAPSTGSAESLPMLLHSQQRHAHQARQYRPHPHSPPSHLPPPSARPHGVRTIGSVESLPVLLHQQQRDQFHHHNMPHYQSPSQYHPLQHSSSPPSSAGVAARRGSSGIPVLVTASRGFSGEADGSPRRHFYGMGGVGGGGGVGSALRSNSAIDLQAAQRAKARAQYAAAARLKVGSGASLRDESSPARPRKNMDGAGNAMSVSAITSPERVGRTRTRVAGVSQSQPSSRSGSPSSRLSYATYSGQLGGGGSIMEGSPTGPHHRPRHLSGIPRSTGTSREASRETSPNGRHYAPQTSLSSSVSPSSHMYHHGRHLSSIGKTRGSMLGRDRPPVSTARPVMAQKMLQQSREAERELADALNFDGLSISDDPHPLHRRKSSSTSGGSGGVFRPFDDHSDDSETSSVCSERSYDSFRRPSDQYSWSGSQQRLYRDVWEPSCKDITEIIGNCASTHWGDRKEGLVGLQLYFQNGNLLSGSELKKIIEIFTKMFMDTHTKVFSLFLDTLNELVASHNSDLHDWLYILLTRLLNKLGTDLLSSTQNKIHKSLEIVRDSFPYDLQMNVILRFLVDQTQTPNAKVKVAMLTYLARLAACMEPTDYSFISGGCISSGAGQTKDTSTMTRLALVKMIGWTSESKSSPHEVRKAAQAAVVALFDLNAPEVTMVLSQLPKEFQETASQVVQNHLRRSSTSGGSSVAEGSASPPVATSPRMPGSPLHAHNAQHLHHHNATHHPSSPHTPRTKRDLGGIHDDENLNPDEVYRSLRKTTAEIQNYSFEAGKGDRDSSIGPMSIGNDDRLGEERSIADIGDNSISNSGSGHSSSLSSPTRLPSFNGIDKSSTSPADSGGGGSFDAIASPENGFSPRGSHLQVGLDDSESLRRVIETLSWTGNGTDGVMEVDGPKDVDGVKANARSDADKKAALTQLIRIIRDGSTLAVMDHFKPILRLLLEQMGGEGAVRALALGALSEMLSKRSFAAAFAQYVELLITKVLFAHKDADKDVVRAAESCAGTMAAVMPADAVVLVLNLLIKTEDFPVNQAAIKMLTRLVEQRGRIVIEPLLPQIMPGLVKAYDNEESSVRKSAVFCMVAIHVAVGEEVLAPHLTALNGSKMKLLHLYIRKAQQQGQGGSHGHSRGTRSGSGDGAGTGSESSSASSPKHTPT